MVKAPVVTTLATAEPLMEPKKALDRTATLAGPPLEEPARARAKSLKNCPIPDLARTAPNRTNKKM